MPKLNQVIAVEKGRKSKANKELDGAYKIIQKPALFEGLARTYTPKDDDGEVYPDEKQPVQVSTPDLVDTLLESLSAYFDVTATKDWANTTAAADVVVDGTAILTDVPITYLLFLEKQLTDLHTFISKLPKLDPAQVWTWDPNINGFRTEAVSAFKTKKIPRNHVLVEATEHHPAQVQVYHEDVNIGTWASTRFSGALPAEAVHNMLERVEVLRDAVKMAREQANEAEVNNVTVGETLFNYVFAPIQDLG